MERYSILPDYWCFALLTQVCVKIGDSFLAKKLFIKVKNKEFKFDINVIDCAQMIQALSRGHMDDSMEVLEWMIEHGIKPDAQLYVCLLKSCTDLAVGKYIHTHIIKTQTKWDIYLENSLLNMYAKCGSMNDARTVFDSIHSRDVVSWNTMITGYGKNGNVKEAIELFNQMQQSGVQPSHVTYTVALSACADLVSLSLGKGIHSQINQSGIEWTTEMRNSLLNMYAKCGSLGDARTVFDSIHSRDVISWNAMIAGYGKNGNAKESLELFNQMQQSRVQPDHFTYTVALSACADLVSLSLGKEIHSQIDQSGIEWTTEMKNSLLNMYAKCGSMDDARTVFDSIHSRSVVSWNAMITGYGQNRNTKEALELFKQMQQSGVQPNYVTYTVALSACADLVALSLGKEIHSQINQSGIEWTTEMKNSLLNMYAKCGSLNDARTVFDSIHSRDVISWNAMITGYGKNGNGKEALELFKQMQQSGVQPNRVTYAIVLSACADLVALSLGKEVHSQINQSGIEWTTEMKNSLLNMYAKCGSMNDARTVFDSIHSRDVISWNAMITGYGQNGNGKEAIELFKQMEKEKIQPDSVTFAALLNACSHSGLKDESLHYLNVMKEKYEITPNVTHYNCVVDTLGRAGYLEESENLIKTMESPDIITWKTLLGACRWNNDIERAERAAENAFKLDPKDASVYVLLANIYAVAGRWEDEAKVRQRMKENGIKKIPGQTWIEINGKVHTFIVNDKVHERSNEIQIELKKVYSEMRESGYIPNTKFVAHNMNEEEKEHHLCSHSEKLAIGLGLISTPPGTPLLITKNLRICPDCHSATMMISKVRNREITVRDANRFHHFKDGQCSCKDYW